MCVQAKGDPSHASNIYLLIATVEITMIIVLSLLRRAVIGKQELGIAGTVSSPSVRALKGIVCVTPFTAVVLPSLLVLFVFDCSF